MRSLRLVTRGHPVCTSPLSMLNACISAPTRWRRGAVQPKPQASRASNFLSRLFHICNPLVEFLFGSLAGVAVLLLEQADDLFGIAVCLFQFIVGEFAPPLFDLALHFLPLAFENILVHDVILLILCICYP